MPELHYSRAGSGDPLVILHGLFGSGKNWYSQSRRFADHLKGQGADVVLTREPGGSPGAEEIRQLVLTGDPDRWSPEPRPYIQVHHDHSH